MRNKRVISITLWCIIITSVITSIRVPIVSAEINISTTISSEVIYQNSTTLSVSINQSGNETAYDVEIYPLLTKDFSFDGTIVAEKLEPKEKLEGFFSIYINEDILQGNYPAVILINYSDAKRNLFSTLSSTLLTYKTSNNSLVHGIFSSSKLTKNDLGEITLNIENLDDRAHEVKINLYLPPELQSSFTQEIMPIDLVSNEKIIIELESNKALSGASYSILASLEYDEDNFHYSSFAYGTVNIAEGKTISINAWVAIAIFIILLVVYIYYKWKGK